ncbi:MAG: tetratricopeptide repeat protein [Aquisalinus sp.]|nr:tetratricopeptide repeat protein [Aquisalinus sp.]
MEKNSQIRFLLAGVVVFVAIAALVLFISNQPDSSSSESTEAELASPKTIEEVVAEFRSSNPDTSPDLLAALKESLTNLETSGNDEKKAALQEISQGNTSAAIERLETLARQNAELADSSILDTAAILREAGAIAYTLDPSRAITNYTNALSLTPSNPDLARELGQIHLALRDYDAAQAAFSRLLQTEGVIDRKARANALRNLGDVEIKRNRYERAAAYYQRSFAEYETAEEPQGMAEALVQLAVTQQLAGNLDQSEIFHRRALALYEETGDQAGAARSLINLGQVEMTRTNIPLAEDYLRRGVSQNLEIGQEIIAARGLGNLGLIEKARGSLYAAEDLHQRALALYEKNDDKAGMARELGNLGNVENDRGNFTEAEAYHSRSLALDEETGRTAGIATTLSNLGGLAQVQGDVPTACDYWQRASALFADLGSDIQYRTVLGWMSKADCGLIE